MWWPSCSNESIKARAELYAQLRAFFMSRGVLEVETPVLSQSGSTDPYLESLCLDQDQTYYLQTSPEFAMKRLLASGIGDIYQVCKSFRCNEVSARHNPEFTMLEWYRIGFSLDELVQEIYALVSEVLDLPKEGGITSKPSSAYRLVTYKKAFNDILNINPFHESLSSLQAMCVRETNYEGSPLDRDGCLDLLLSVCIEPSLGVDKPCFLIDYPESQAALARIEVDAEGDRVGRRAELYIRGLELANAYDELTDAVEQRRRFEEDLLMRSELGLPNVTLDSRLLEALEDGIPACAGVALGIDRLLMLKMGASSLSDVVAFTHERA